MRLFTCIYPSETALAHLDLALVNLPDMATAAFESEIANFDGPSATQFSRGQFSRDQFSSGQRGRGHRGGKESRPRGGRSSQDQKLRWVPPEFRHITLAFHGDVPEGAVPDYLGELRNAVQDFEPFEARLSGSGAFSGRTLWTGVSGSEGLSQLKSLSTLVAEAAVEASLRSDNRAGGRPDLTLARQSSQYGAPLDAWVHALVLYRGPLFWVDEVHVVRSELGKGRQGGPQYSDVAVLPLDGGRGYGSSPTWVGESEFPSGEPRIFAKAGYPSATSSPPAHPDWLE